MYSLRIDGLFMVRSVQERRHLPQTYRLLSMQLGVSNIAERFIYEILPGDFPRSLCQYVLLWIQSLAKEIHQPTLKRLPLRRIKYIMRLLYTLGLQSQKIYSSRYFSQKCASGKEKPSMLVINNPEVLIKYWQMLGHSSEISGNSSAPCQQNLILSLRVRI